MENMSDKVSPEQGFRSSLEDVIAVVEKLGRVCQTTEELVEVCRLALTSDAQLRLLMREVTNKK